MRFSLRKRRTDGAELLAVDSRRDPRSGGKSFIRSAAANSTGSLAVIQKFRELSLDREENNSSRRERVKLTTPGVSRANVN